MPGGSDVTAIHAWYNRSSGLGLMVVGDCANMTSATGSDVTNASSLAFEYYGILHLVVTSLILGSIILATILGKLLCCCILQTSYCSLCVLRFWLMEHRPRESCWLQGGRKYSYIERPTSFVISKIDRAVDIGKLYFKSKF